MNQRTYHIRKLAAGAAFALVAGLAAQAQAGTITNGSFETGDFTGWTVSSTAHVTTTQAKLDEQGTWDPTDGRYFAYVEGDTQDLYFTIEQTFNASAGQTLTFDVFFDAGDYYDVSGNVTFNDDGYAALSSLGALYEKSVFDVGDYGSDGWTSVSHTFVAGGTYTLTFGVRNTGDASFDSRIGIDNVQLTGAVVPLPPTAFMGLGLLGGLGGIGWLRRRRRTS